MKLKIKFNIYLTIVILLFCVNTLLGEERTIPRFLIDYAVVDRSLKNRKGYAIELLKLYQKDPNSATLIADFWHQKAVRECQKCIETNVDLYLQKITPNMTQEEKDKVMEPAKEAATQCFYSFYYDNFDEINKTIVNKLKVAKINYRKNNYIWYFLLVITVILLIVFWRKRKVLMSHQGGII